MDTDLAPRRKVTAAGIGGAVGIIVTWLLGMAVEVPAEVAGAISTVMAFLFGYLVPE